MQEHQNTQKILQQLELYKQALLDTAQLNKSNEHSYRTQLQNLLNALKDPSIRIIHEPQAEVGQGDIRPDFKVYKQVDSTTELSYNALVGFIECIVNVLATQSFYLGIKARESYHSTPRTSFHKFFGGTLETFRNITRCDLSIEEFCDLLGQSVVYGLLVAYLEIDSNLEHIGVEGIATLLPKEFHLLSEFIYFSIPYPRTCILRTRKYQKNHNPYRQSNPCQNAQHTNRIHLNLSL